MQPDPAGNGDSTLGTGIKDQDLMAGATSSTNWPQEDAGRQPQLVKGSADSSLILYFMDSTKTRIRMSGTLTLFKAGKIPALDAPDSLRIGFVDQDSIKVTSGALHAFSNGKDDTLYFSVLVEFGDLECFLAGFSYSPSLKKFLDSPFSEEPNYSGTISDRHYSIHGVPDSSLLNKGISSGGKIEWCFYIPGSPFYFKVSSDTAIDIGPVPQGQYPIRLLKVTEADGGSNRTQLDVYEVKVVDGLIDSMHHTSYNVIQSGEKIFTTLLSSPVSIRANKP
jgi:hypothetical protein